MARSNTTTGKIRCSFCGKTQDEVKKLIAGPNGVYICNDCIEICSDILDEVYRRCHPRSSSRNDVGGNGSDFQEV